MNTRSGQVRWSVSCRPFLVAATALGLPGGAAGADGNGAAFEFRPGVVVNADRSVCYLMNTDGGIDAVDLRSGRALWTTTHGQRPLVLLADTLVAQAEPDDSDNVLRLVFLDTTESGAPRARTDVDLPVGLRATIDDGPGTTFRVRAWAARDALMVAWTYSETLVRGAEDALRDGSPVRAEQGTVRVDLETGAVSPAEPGPGPETPMPSAATGDPAAGYTIRYPSADHRHLLASRRDRTPGAEPRYDWLIVSLPTGDPVAELSMSSPGAWFFVAGPLLVHEVPAAAHLVDGARIREPKRLRAMDLRTGVERWARPLRDTAYRGELPPGGQTP